MKTLHLKTFVLTLGLFIFTSASAHDPSEHKKDAEKPKCEAMADMEHSEMNSDDPVMQAMMEKCKAAHMDKKNDKGMMDDHAEAKSEADEKMADHHTDDDAQTESNTTEEHGDDSHSDDHD